MRRVLPLFTFCLLLIAQPLFAQSGQQRLFALSNGEIVELDPRLPSLGAVIRRFPQASGGGTVAFGGGAYLAWANEQGVFLLDTSTGAVRQFNFPGFTPGSVVGTDGNSRLLVLGYDTARKGVLLTADARSGQIRFIEVGEPFFAFSRLAYAPETDTLFMARPRTGPAGSPEAAYDVDVINLSTGAVLKTLDIFPVNASSIRTNLVGTQLLVSDTSLLDGADGTFGFDVASGGRTASSAATDLTYGSPIFDEPRNRLVVSLSNPTAVEAFAMDSLQLLGKVSVPWPKLTADSIAFGSLDVSSQSATMFMLQNIWATASDTCLESRLVALDADTGQVRRVVSTTAALGPCGGGLLRITEPGPPSGFTAESTGAQVLLRWLPTKGATSYQIEAGSGSGLSNLATVNVTDPRLTVDGVPPGTYDIRVRAINTIGKSAPSQEVHLVVQ